MGGGSNLYPPEQFDTFTQEQIQERVKGSKIVVLSEQVGFKFYVLPCYGLELTLL